MIRRVVALWPVVVMCLGLPVTPVDGAELTAFLATGTPGEDWGSGFGGALTTNWFEVLSFEGEAALLRADTAGSSPELKMASFTASAVVAPPIGIVTPYGGVGFGLFRQSDPVRSDTGNLRAFILGAKLSLGVVSVRADYRSIRLSGEPLLPIGSRYYLGASIRF
jgi:hypothetical protein